MRHLDHRPPARQAPSRLDWFPKRSCHRGPRFAPEHVEGSFTAIGERLGHNLVSLCARPNRRTELGGSEGPSDLSAQASSRGGPAPSSVTMWRPPSCSCPTAALSLSLKSMVGSLPRGGRRLVSGLAPLVAGTDTTWIAAALSPGDRLAAHRGIVDSRRAGPHPRHRRHILRLAYDVVCNSTLWFLHHGLHDLSRAPSSITAGSSVEAYRSYNQQFADAVVAEAPDGATVLVQDYHLALLGTRLREARPDLTTVHFSHTPFAPPHLMRVLPSAAAVELLDGMASHTTCGFHSRRWADDYRASCRELLGRDVAAFVAPLAPDPGDLDKVVTSDACERAFQRAEANLAGRQVIVR